MFPPVPGEDLGSGSFQWPGLDLQMGHFRLLAPVLPEPSGYRRLYLHCDPPYNRHINPTVH